MGVEVLVFVSVLALGTWVYYLHMSRNKQLAEEMSRLGQVIAVHQDVRKILLAGLYQRFRGAERRSRENQKPDEFERFCAKVLQHALGGHIDMASEIHEGGVDLIHELDDQIFLGQTRCVPRISLSSTCRLPYCTA